MSISSRKVKFLREFNCFACKRASPPKRKHSLRLALGAKVNTLATDTAVLRYLC